MFEEKEDFFEDTPVERPKRVRPPKEPRYKADDPRYYDREEGRWDHLKPSPYRRSPLLWLVGGAIVCIVLIWWLLSYLFSPYVKDAVEFGYVENVQKEGKVFDTFEGVIIPYKTIKDKDRKYEGDFIFSTTDDHLAAMLRRQQASGQPVMVHYKVYHTAMPWRGKSKITITAVDSIDPRTILPPDRRPAHP